MADQLDLILLGATGHTGKLCIPYLHKLSKSNSYNLTWGVAGRSEKKLKQVLENAEESLGISLQNIPIILVDVEDENSLQKMVQQTKVVLNCCGPYRSLGEAVIKACIDAGTHYTDVSSSLVEPQFAEKIQVELDEAAKKKGTYVINACGVDSIAGDVGIEFLQQKFEGTLNAITVYLEICKKDEPTSGPILSYGTFKSAVYGFGYRNELKEIRKKLTPKQLPVLEPKLKLRIVPHKPIAVNGWAVAFPGSESSILRKSQAYFYEFKQKRPAQIYTYVVFPFFWHLLFLIFVGAGLILIRFVCCRNLLLKYPKIFSAGLVSEEQQKFVDPLFQVTFHGEGWKKKITEYDLYTTPCDRFVLGRVTSKISTYEFSALALVLSSIVMVTEIEKCLEVVVFSLQELYFQKRHFTNSLLKMALPSVLLTEKIFSCYISSARKRLLNFKSDCLGELLPVFSILLHYLYIFM